MKAPFCQHMHLFCKELEPMIAFWVNGFGATMEGYRKFGPADGAVLDLHASVKLYLKVVDCLPADATTARAGVDHLGMIVENLDAALATLTALPGVTLSREPFMSGTLRCAFVAGPEGIQVEVMEQTA